MCSSIAIAAAETTSHVLDQQYESSYARARLRDYASHAAMSRPVALVVGAAMAAASLQRVAEAFVPGLPAAISDRCRAADHSSFPTRLHDIHDWRDTVFDVQSEDDSVDDNSFDPSPLREVCVLPFPLNDVLLQGETKNLRLYEERFIQLFDDAMDNFGGVVAMGLIAENGIIQSAPLCNIEAFNRMDGFGIFVTIRVVSRVSITGVTQGEPYIKATCKEIFDEVPQGDADVQLLSTIAGNIENMLLTISAMEHRLKGALQSAGDDSLGRGNQDIDDDRDDDYDDDDDVVALDRTGRFRRAYELAKETDAQGYISSAEADESSENRSLQDLSAISWAAFETERLHEDDEQAGIVVGDDGQLLASSDTLYRMQALASAGIMDRMKLALTCLHGKRVEINKALND